MATDRNRARAGLHDGAAGGVAHFAGVGDRGAVSGAGAQCGVFEYAGGVERDGGGAVFVFCAGVEWVFAGGVELVEV